MQIARRPKPEQQAYYAEQNCNVPARHSGKRNL
jgi:hypothetical protein